MEMSKIGPDAEWSMCWKTGYGTTAPQFEDFHPSRLEKDHFSQDAETSSGDHYSDDIEDDPADLIFAASLLTSQMWRVKRNEDDNDECRVEVDGELVRTWEKRQR
jgi:hypothetical protein